MTISIGIAGLVVAFIKGWKLSLVVISTLPLLILSGFLFTYALQ